MTKVLFATVTLVGFYLLVMFLLLNIMTGCGMVNDWTAPECITPAQLMGLG